MTLKEMEKRDRRILRQNAIAIKHNYELIALGKMPKKSTKTKTKKGKKKHVTH